MIKWLLKRLLNSFERRYGYDTTYARHIVDTDVGAMLKMSKLTGMAKYRKDVPKEAWFAAKIAASMREDCGPCTQLAVSMAEEEHVDADVLRAVAARDVHAMPADVSLAYRFAEAVLDRAPEADALRDEARELWGDRGVLSLAFGIAASRIFPTVKYALGHGKACMRLTVDGTVVETERRAA